MAALLPLRTLSAILLALHATTVAAQPILPEAPVVVQDAAALTISAAPSSSAAIRIAAANSPGAPLIGDIVPQGQSAFSSFDMRPIVQQQKLAFSIPGYTNMPIWTADSVNSAMTVDPLAKQYSSSNGAISSSKEAAEAVQANVQNKQLAFFGFDAEQSFGFDSTNAESSSNFASAFSYNSGTSSSISLPNAKLPSLVLADNAKQLLQAGDIDQFIIHMVPISSRTLNMVVMLLPFTIINARLVMRHNRSGQVCKWDTLAKLKQPKRM